MGTIIQVLFFIFTGIFLLWFGYTLFFSLPASGQSPGHKNRLRPKGGSASGASSRTTCPVCSALLEKGERVKSAAFPSTGGTDRLMHIAGCVYCLGGGRTRVCPVCGSQLFEDEYLIARLFDKPGRSHVHVLGCNRCKRPGISGPRQR
jgi:RNA polymerase subunit RPABC4/transcription elongation factor Spt4